MVKGIVRSSVVVVLASSEWKKTCPSLFTHVIFKILWRVDLMGLYAKVHKTVVTHV